MAVAGLPELDVLGCEGFDGAGCVDDAGSRGAGADVDADVVVLGGRVSMCVRECVCL